MELDEFSVRVRKLAQDLNGDQLKTVMTELGVAAKKDAEEALRGDIGDMSMSNWRRGRPVQIGARFDVSAAGTEVAPTPRSRGPWKVLEDGRRAGRSRGSRSRKARSFGSSRGKGTWTDARRLTEERTPRRALDAIHKLIKNRLG